MSSSSRYAVVLDQSPRSSAATVGSSRSSTDSGYSSSRSQSSAQRTAYFPTSSDESKLSYGSSKASAGYKATEYRSGEPKRSLVRTPEATGLRYKSSGGPRPNPHGFEKVSRRSTSGKEVVVLNYGITEPEIGRSK